MKRIFTLIIVFCMYYYALSQQDTSKISWGQVLYVVHHPNIDSLGAYDYYQKMKPYYSRFFNSFTKSELDSLDKKTFEMAYHPNQDSITNPAYLQQFHISWGIHLMLGNIMMDNFSASLENAYNAKGDTIGLCLFKQGTRVNLNNNFQVVFVLNKDNGLKHIVHAQTLDNAFLFPDLGAETSGKLLLKYRRRYYDITFCGNYLQDLRKEITIHIYDENKPFRHTIPHSPPYTNSEWTIHHLWEKLKENPGKKGVIYTVAERFWMCSHCYFKRRSDYFKQTKNMVMFPKTLDVGY